MSLSYLLCLVFTCYTYRFNNTDPKVPSWKYVIAATMSDNQVPSLVYGQVAVAEYIC